MSTEPTAARASRVFQVTIPAGSSQELNCYGNSFYFITSAGVVLVESDNMPRRPYTQGRGEVYPPGFAFKSITVYNPAATPVYIEVWMGFGGSFIDNRQSVLPAPTRLNFVAATLAANSGVTLNTLSGASDVRRAWLQISNADTTLNVQVRDMSDNICLIVRPLDVIREEISGPCKVFNPNGAAITCYISEVIYTAT